MQTNEICDGGTHRLCGTAGIESYGECGGSRVWPLSAAARSSCHPAMRLACPTKPPPHLSSSVQTACLINCATQVSIQQRRMPDCLVQSNCIHWSVTGHIGGIVLHPKPTFDCGNFFGMLMMEFTNLIANLAFVVFIYRVTINFH